MLSISSASRVRYGQEFALQDLDVALANGDDKLKVPLTISSANTLPARGCDLTRGGLHNDAQTIT